MKARVVGLCALSTVGLTASVIIAASPAQAAGCSATRAATTYAWAQCHGFTDTGHFRVAVNDCSASGCYGTSGPWKSKAGNPSAISSYNATTGHSITLRTGTCGLGVDCQNN